MGSTSNHAGDFSGLVESVYETVAQPEQWSGFLEALARALNAKSGLFRVVDEREPAVRANVHYNLDPALQEAHRAYYVTRDAYLEALRDKPGGFMAPGEAVVDQGELRRTEFFTDYLAPQDSHHVCGGVVMRNEEFTIMLGVQRDRRRGPFDEADAAFMQRFAPHIRRAARLEHLLDLADRQTASVEQALESMAVGVVLLDEQERIRHTNSKAQSLLRERRGITRSQGRFAPTQPSDAGRVREVLELVRERSCSASPSIPETVLLTPGPGEPQLLLVACPVSAGQSQFQGPWPQVTTAVFVSNLADAGLLNHEILVTLYGLTATEARLACALSRGNDLTELAEEWRISRETLRTHLKRVLHKTGTTRQAELVRLLAGAPWRLAGNDPANAAAVPA